MKTKTFSFFSLLLVATLFLSACGPLQALAGKQIKIGILYGSEKQGWLEPMIAAYNAARHKTADEAAITVEGTVMGSIESFNAIMNGQIQPTVWSPASSIYIPVANAQWRQSHGVDLVTGTPKDLVLSPVVIAMWEPMARALGWPDKSLGWSDIAALATSSQGWAAYGYPEWGSFKFGHTHPGYSNSGLDAVIAEAYAGAGKPRGLTAADLSDPKVVSLMTDVESSIIHYGTSTGFFADRMFQRGPSYLSAAVLYENLVVQQESSRLSGASQQLPVVAIYPREGTFWANHPYTILNAPWVTDQARAAAADFQAFLLDRPQQLKALSLGFRPADPSIPLGAPLDAQHGVDTSEPKTVLETPTVDVISGVQALWDQVKKPVDLVVLLDVSGSMQGDKITSARKSLLQFVDLLGDRDRLEVIIFSSDITTLTDLTLLGPKRQSVKTHISGIIEGGNTRLYDAVAQGYQELQQKGDPSHIRAMAVLTDGQDTQSSLTLDDLVARINASSQEGGTAIKLFTIAYGSDADKTVLTSIADPSGGKEYDSTPENINKVYQDIATFF
jgi:Ca-activated chloride channel family protein